MTPESPGSDLKPMIRTVCAMESVLRLCGITSQGGIVHYKSPASILPSHTSSMGTHSLEISFTNLYLVICPQIKAD